MSAFAILPLPLTHFSHTHLASYLQLTLLSPNHTWRTHPDPLSAVFDTNRRHGVRRRGEDGDEDRGHS
jgi:hypothetical protein